MIENMRRPDGLDKSRACRGLISFDIRGGWTQTVSARRLGPWEGLHHDMLAPSGPVGESRMKALGSVLVVLGVVFLALAGINSSKAPNVSYLIGTYLPGLFCLIVGLKLGKTKKTKPGSPNIE